MKRFTLSLDPMLIVLLKPAAAHFANNEKNDTLYL